jgi:hypothetical protein
MIVLYFVFLMVNFSLVASDSKIQRVDAISNSTVTAVVPSTHVMPPNLEVRSPAVAPITSEVKSIEPSDVQSVIHTQVETEPEAGIANTTASTPDQSTNEAVQVEAPVGESEALISQTTIPEAVSDTASATDNAPAMPVLLETSLDQPEIATPSKPKTNIVEKKPKPKTEKEEVMSSINTLDVEEEGNWLLKRVWWEQSEQTFEKIIALNDDVVKLQIGYISKRSEWDKKLNELFRKLGFDQGEISEVIEYFLHQLSMTREFEGLEPNQREFFDLLNAKKEELEKLKLDLNSLSELDTSIDDVITQLVDQVNKSRDFEKNAWQDFKEIGRVLNDKKAKTLFYQIEADLKSIQNIQTYLSVELKKYYQDLLDNVDKASNSIVKKVYDLEKEIGNLKEQFEKLQKEEETRKQNELENKLKSQSEAKQPKSKKQNSWFGSFWDKITSIF